MNANGDTVGLRKLKEQWGERLTKTSNPVLRKGMTDRGVTENVTHNG